VAGIREPLDWINFGRAGDRAGATRHATWVWGYGWVKCEEGKCVDEIRAFRWAFRRGDGVISGRAARAVEGLIWFDRRAEEVWKGMVVRVPEELDGWAS